MDFPADVCVETQVHLYYCYGLGTPALYRSVHNFCHHVTVIESLKILQNDIFRVRINIFSNLKDIEQYGICH